MKAICNISCYDSTNNILYREGVQYTIKKELAEQYKKNGLDKKFTELPKTIKEVEAEAKVL